MENIRKAREFGRVLGMAVVVFGALVALRLLGTRVLPGDRDEDDY